MSANRWQSDWGWEPKPRLAVEGGVRVARPGKVTGAEAVYLVQQAISQSTAAMPSRARTYARHGQVVGVEIIDRVATARIQGSDAEPYSVELRRAGTGSVKASCDCPYGCIPRAWCKHAVALAYVTADLIDHDAAALARWTGSADAEPEPAGVAPTPELLGRLRAPTGRLDVARILAEAAEVVPLPGEPFT